MIKKIFEALLGIMRDTFKEMRKDNFKIVQVFLTILIKTFRFLYKSIHFIIWYVTFYFFWKIQRLKTTKTLRSWGRFLMSLRIYLVFFFSFLFFLFFFKFTLYFMAYFFYFYFPLILFLLINFIRALALVVPLLIGVAFFTLIERKVLGGIHRRRGPNVVGFWGMLQPFADGLKLIIKETVMPSTSNRILFVFAPILTLLLSLLGWAAIPLGNHYVFIDLNFGILFIFAISSLGVYGVIMAGWSSNSKYAFLGAMRAAAQMVSYEVSIGLIVICVIFCSGSLNLSQIVYAQKYIWYCIPLFPICLMFFVSALAETNRPPFDLPEAEAELVAGYNVEYSAVGFALFFIGEYSNILVMSSLTVILFFGGWLPPFFFLDILPSGVWFAFKLFFIIFTFVWVRASFPRYRYDQLMRLGWKVFLPLSLAWVVFISSFLFVFDFLA